MIFFILRINYCVKIVRIWSYSGPNTENVDRNNSECRHFSRSECLKSIRIINKKRFLILLKMDIFGANTDIDFILMHSF